MALPISIESLVTYRAFSNWEGGHPIYDNYEDSTSTEKSAISLIIPINQNSLFIPSIIQNKLIDSVVELAKSTENPYDTLIVPLGLGNGQNKATTSSAVIKSFFSTVGNDLYKIKVSDSLSYIGGKGLILKSDWTPLIMYGFTMNLYDRGTDNVRIEMTNPTVYINPIVYGSIDILSKYIVKRIVPELIKTKAILEFDWDYCSSKVYLTRKDETIRVIIEDFSHMFYNVQAPTRLDFSDILQEQLAHFTIE